MRSIQARSLVTVHAHGVPGALSEVTSALGEAGINIDGFSIQAGKMAFLMDDPDAARAVLEPLGFEVSSLKVFGLVLPNEPGSLGRLLEALEAADVHILHSFGLGQGRAGTVYVRLDDLERALPALRDLPEVRARR